MLTNFQLRKFLAREVLGTTLRKPPQREKRGPERDATYLAWIRTQPCEVCKCESRSEAAHTGDHGLGQKASDLNAIPLCATCHRIGPQSYHRLGGRAFERTHGVSCAQVVTRLNAKWRELAA
jgi:hypothetical protein